MKNALCSWSGGKDSCFALMKAIEKGFSPKVLLNVLNENGRISRSHGIPDIILQAQSDATGLPIHMISSSWADYENNFVDALKELKAKYQLDFAIFGDIDLDAHKEWEDKVCEHSGLSAVLPLWKQNRKDLVIQMIDAGIEAMIVSCNEVMGSSFPGRIIDPELIDELEAMNIDACGENGEYHTLVINCPLYKSPISVEVRNKILHNGYWFSELELSKKKSLPYQERDHK